MSLFGEQNDQLHQNLLVLKTAAADLILAVESSSTLLKAEVKKVLIDEQTGSLREDVDPRSWLTINSERSIVQIKYPPLPGYDIVESDAFTVTLPQYSTASGAEVACSGLMVVQVSNRYYVQSPILSTVLAGQVVRDISYGNLLPPTEWWDSLKSQSSKLISSFFCAG